MERIHDSLLSDAQIWVDMPERTGIARTPSLGSSQRRALKPGEGIEDAMVRANRKSCHYRRKVLVQHAVGLPRI